VVYKKVNTHKDEMLLIDAEVWGRWGNIGQQA
jgi:hypothetical protein